MSPSQLATIALPIALVTLATPAPADDVEYRVIAVTGDAAPGAGGSFTAFSHAHINGAGEVSFSAATNAEVAATGMWRTRQATLGQLHLLAASGLQVPGAPGGVVYGGFDFSFYHPLLNEAGNVGFSAPIAGHPDGDLALMREIDGVIAPNAMPGDAAPGFAPGYTFADFSNLPAFSDGDLMAFRATIAGPGINETNDHAIYANWIGGLNRYAWESQPAPGRPGTTIDWLSGVLPQINSNGKVAFRAGLAGADEGTSLWTGWPGLLEPVLLPGDVAPTGDPFLNGSPGFWGQNLSLAGVGFPAWVDDAGDPALGLWFTDGVTTSAIAVENQIGPLGTYVHLGSHDGTCNATGEAVFAAQFEGQGVNADNNTAVFASQPGVGTGVVFREGDSVPSDWGLDSEFDSIFVGASTETIDDAGRVYANAAIRGVGIDATNDFGAWIFDAGGPERLIIREGQMLDLGAAGVKQVKNWTFGASAGSQTGRDSGVNAFGDVVLRVTFTDDAQAIVVAQIPPACLGDVNFDGTVDFQDLVLVLSNWGLNGAIGQDGDADEDGDKDFDDLLIVLTNWGPCFPV